MATKTQVNRAETSPDDDQMVEIPIDQPLLAEVGLEYLLSTTGTATQPEEKSPLSQESVGVSSDETSPMKQQRPPTESNLGKRRIRQPSLMTEKFNIKRDSYPKVINMDMYAEQHIDIESDSNSDELQEDTQLRNNDSIAQCSQDDQEEPVQQHVFEQPIVQRKPLTLERMNEISEIFKRKQDQFKMRRMDDAFASKR